MDNMLRKFGLKKSEPRETDARQKLQKELFAYNKCIEHGFPNKVSAIGYDPRLGLLALGTKTGVLRIFGAPGVEFSAHHKDDVTIFHIVLFGQGQIVTFCSDSCLYLWEISIRDSVSHLEEVRALPLENKVKTVSASCLTAQGDQLLLGTESGHIFIVDLKSFKLQEKVIYQETIIQNAPDDFKVNPGAVEAIVQHPTKLDRLLIGYNRGLIVLWDYKLGEAEQIYNSAQQLESLTFLQSGEEFLSSHGNGSYIAWNTTAPNKPKEQGTTPYGPFPCKAITKIQWKTTKSGERMMVFSGGMPRASYGDRHTVTVMQGTAKHVVFDFTSKVIDFFTICSADEATTTSRADCEDPHTLVILVEEEMVAIDLASPGWPTFRAPYLPSLHSSAITCTAHVGNVPRALWKKLCDAGELQLTGYSTRDWPIQGGINLLPEVATRDMLITGHEDGSLRFWDVSSTSILLLYKLQTAAIFGSGLGGDNAEPDPDEEWPPFRKVGTYDPFSDDPRLAIQKVALCPVSEQLVAGGTAGQVIVLQFEREERRQEEVRQIGLNIIGDRDNFVWKGHDALPARTRDARFAPGFQPVCVVQMYPPAACTALTFNSEWQLVACGTAHGFGLVDYVQRRLLLTRCTLNPTDLTGIGESTMSRRKSFKKSLRESFRRLRSRRSDRRRRPGAATGGASGRDSGGARASPINSPRKGGSNASTPSRQWHSGGDAGDPDSSPKPVERAVEARSADDVSGSIVRALYFADTFLVSGQHHAPTMWAGTNAGSVFVYQLTVPTNEKREAEPVQCILAKEIHLRHHAPVISICVIDRHHFPLPAPLDVQHERARHPDMSGGHSVVICSEEQLKVFALPSLAGRDKFKLTAHEGTKIRKVGYVNFCSRSDGSYVESDLVCLTNQGEVHVYSVPHLRRQLRADCVKKDNIIGIVSSVFTQSGEGFYLSSPSEFIRFSVSAHVASRPVCIVRAHNENARAALASDRSDGVASRRSGEGVKRSTPTSVHKGRAESQSPSRESGGAASPMGGGVLVGGAGGIHDDSVASGDTTADSVRVHISEDSMSAGSPLSSNNNSSVLSSSSRRIVTSTVTVTTATEGSKQRTVVETTRGSAGGFGGAGAPRVTSTSPPQLNHRSPTAVGSGGCCVFDQTCDESGFEELCIVEEGDNLSPAVNRRPNHSSAAPQSFNERSIDVEGAIDQPNSLDPIVKSKGVTLKVIGSVAKAEGAVAKTGNSRGVIFERTTGKVVGGLGANGSSSRKEDATTARVGSYSYAGIRDASTVQTTGASRAETTGEREREVS